jgi:hypothetical protein
MLLVCAVSVNAATITDPDSGLTLDTDPTEIFGQTAASPCVIGGNNCHNGGFPMTLEGSGGSGTTSDVTNGFFYTVGQISGLVSTAFRVGLDYNQTNDPQTLTEFEALYYTDDDDSALLSSQLFDVETVLQTNNNGVGFSDFLLSGFAIPAAATHVKFHAEWFNNDGPDRYFLIGPDAQPIPEPSSLLLMGSGLLGLVYWRRRRMSRLHS